MLNTLGQRYGAQRSAIFSMGMLYLGKTSGILVAFIFLPVYSRLLGVEHFGVVAVVLSLQALLTMMDLGMATLVSRAVALAHDRRSPSNLIRTAELCLTAFYGTVLVLVAIAKSAGLLAQVSWLVVMCVPILLWALVQQNLYYAALLARREYSISSGVQLVGVSVRAALTTLALVRVETTLEMFFIAQLLVAFLHMATTRIICFRGAINNSFIPVPTIKDCIELMRQGLPLLLFAAAGAAATQLDKPLISALSSAGSVTSYFLATTLCMVPISLLAGPVSQFFQPKLLAAIGARDEGAAHRTLTRFVWSTLVITGVPAAIVWFLREPLVNLWLGANAGTETVVTYVAILLPGFTIGALGFIPYSLLIAAQDYRFQAGVSSVLTILTLGAVTVAAARTDVEAICWIYAAYHTASTCISWARAATLKGAWRLGCHSLRLAAQLALSVFGCAWIINTFILK